MKETHTKAQLQEFRRKLVKAKNLEKKHLSFPQDSQVFWALDHFNIEYSLSVIGFVISMQPKSRRSMVAALFDNSIADIDRRIKELK